MRQHGLLTIALLVFPGLFPASPASARDLTFEDRVNAQEAIERLYYAHQVGVKEPFEEAIGRTLLEDKVRNYLLESAALERFWNTPVTGPMLRSELDRMVQQTRMPGRLVELFGALGNDSFLIEECLARPVLVHRLVRNFFALDQELHSSARSQATAIHDGLVANDIDPWAAHPSRTVTRVIRSSSLEQPGAGTHPGAGTRLNPEGESVRLELDATAYTDWISRVPKRVGEIGPLVETQDTFVIRVLLDSGLAEVLVASYVVPKRPWDEWWNGVKGALSPDLVLPVAFEFDLSNDLAALSGSTGSATCLADTWNNQSLNGVPGPRYYHTAVWTGNLMLVWGGAGPKLNGFFNTGGRYDPATDTWSSIATLNAPASRGGHTAVWTGSRMIVWGGFSGKFGPYLNTGGRYDPVADVWQPTSLVNAPFGRTQHSAIWTGSSMIVWGGGAGGTSNTGARYDPATDVWSPTTTAGAPSSRYMHSAVWTGGLMIVWGGRDFVGTDLNTGGRYDPVADSWTPTSTLNAPSARNGHAAIWTGSVMVIWGRFFYSESSEARYDPLTDTWTPMSLVGAPTNRRQSTAVWTGHEVIIWGGADNAGHAIYFNSGAKYNPVTDTWTGLSSVNAPAGRFQHTAVWTGDTMIVWGGWNETSTFNDGGRYDVEHDSWTPTSLGGAPAARTDHTAIWTGSAMVVWGGYGESLLNSGGAYDPAIDSWSATPVTGSPAPRWGHHAVWTGSDMIIWGGQDPTVALTGGRYHVASGTWFPVSTRNSYPGYPSGSSVWTGSRMILWGGGYGSPGVDNHGGQYDPVADAWTPTSTVGAPERRTVHTAVWTGDRMIVWGGGGLTQGWLTTGGQYDPVGDRWTTTSTVNAPRIVRNSAVWTGQEMIVWGGFTTTGSMVNLGARYNPSSDTWTAMSTVHAPAGRAYHATIWTGSTMVVWGGSPDSLFTFLATGGQYDPAADAWSPTAIENAPSARALQTAVWTGDSMIVWGGYDNTRLNTGGRYCTCTTITFYKDSDGDGFGDPGAPMQACSELPGFVVDKTDCDDSNAAVHPGSTDLCNGIDDDCSGQVDEGFSVGAGCTEAVDACRQINGINECLADGTGTRCHGQAVFHDVTPPTLTCPSEATAECPAQPTLGSASATDACDPDPVIVEDAPEDFPLGTTTVLWRATDASGNTSSCLQAVHEVDTTPPTLVCPTPLASECSSPLGAVVTLGATARDACSSMVAIQNNRTPNGADASGTYPLGLSPLVFTARDPSGNIASCTASVTVSDTMPPRLTVVSDAVLLWPPNHELIPVHFVWQVDDVCAPNPDVALRSVASSEPDDAPGMGDGSTIGDVQGADLGTADDAVDLRAERAGSGPGRTYTLMFRAVDPSGNATPAVAVITVPHDQGQGPEPLLMRLEPDGTSGMVRLYWPAMPGATGYDVIFGEMSQVRVENGKLNLGEVGVLARGTTVTSLSENAASMLPPTGTAFFYLIEPRTERGGVGYGAESAPWPRVPASCAGGCP
jgi:N-acetylneuraminic acid mutarotase